MTDNQKVFVQCRLMKKDETVSVDELAVKAGVAAENVIIAVKLIIDNQFDRKENFCMEFSNDYTMVIKKQSFADAMQQAYFDYYDNKNWKKNYGKRNSSQGK